MPGTCEFIMLFHIFVNNLAYSLINVRSKYNNFSQDLVNKTSLIIEN